MSLSDTRTKKSLVAAVALSAALGLSACGGGSSDTASAAESTSASVSRPEPVASIPALSGGSTAVSLDADFAAALESLGLTPGTVGDATLADGSISFPISGGTVTVYDQDSGYRPWVQGSILHQNSGLSLTAGETTVELTNFTVDPGKPARLFGDVAVNGEQAVASAPLFILDGRTLEPLQTTDAGEAVLEGTQVKFTQAAADLLNQTFGTDALAEGFLVGTATITVPTS
jgi:hypothetical protein